MPFEYYLSTSIMPFLVSFWYWLQGRGSIDLLFWTSIGALLQIGDGLGWGWRVVLQKALIVDETIHLKKGKA